MTKKDFFCQICRDEIPCALEKRRKYMENENSLQAYIEGSLRCPFRPENRSKRRKIFEEGKYLFCGGINEHIIQITKKVQKKSYGLCGTGWPGVCWPCCFSTWATLSTQSGHPSWVSWATLVGPVGSLQSFWSPSSSTPSSSEGLVTRQFNMQARDSSPRSGLLFHVHCPKLNMAINVFVSWWKKEDKIFWYFWHIFSLAGPSCQGFSPLWLTRPSSCRSP